MSDLIQRITSDLHQKIDSFHPEYEVRDVGTVDEAGDGIARVRGLAKVRSQELVEFSNGVMGIAFNLEEEFGWGDHSRRLLNCKRRHDRLEHKPHCLYPGGRWPGRPGYQRHW